MSEKYKLSDIVLSEEIAYNTVEDIKIDHISNHYARAVITVQADQEQIQKISRLAGDEQAILIALKQGGGGLENLFQGLFRSYKTWECEIGSMVTIYADGMGRKLNHTRHTRVFQGYEKLAEIAAKLKDLAKGSKTDFQIKEDISVNKIEYQQDETDWEFLLRLAGRKGVSVYEDRAAAVPTLYVGKENTAGWSDSDLYEISTQRDFAACLEDHEKYTGGGAVEYLRRDTETVSGVPLVAMAGHVFKGNVVVESHIYVEKDKLLNCLVLGKNYYDKMAFHSSYVPVPKQKVYLLGTVAEASISEEPEKHGLGGAEGSAGERKPKDKVSDKRMELKIQFDDEVLKGNSAGNRLWIPYESQLSNYVYCMPDVGDRIYCYYTDGGNCTGMGLVHQKLEDNDFTKPKEKVFNNLNQRIHFYKDSLEFVSNREEHENGGAYARICLNKKNGITLESTGNIRIHAEKELSIDSKNRGATNIEAGNNVNLCVGQSSINIQNGRMDIKGAKVDFKGTSKTGTYTAIPGTGKIERTKIFSPGAKGKDEKLDSIKQLIEEQLEGHNSRSAEKQEAYLAMCEKLFSVCPDSALKAEETLTGEALGDAAGQDAQGGSNALYKRGSFRKNSRDKAEAEAPRDSMGNMICPTCGKVIPKKIVYNTKNGPKTRIGYDLDHYPKTWEQRVVEMKESVQTYTRKEVLDEYNKDLRIQCPPCNQGHEYEGIRGEFADGKD